jgi:hypothetical protein
VPGWHAKTKELEADAKLSVIGITQEQHPDRTVLFMQWQKMQWPVMLDSLNLLGCKGIPFTLLIDEHSIIRHSNPSDEDLQTFLRTEFEEPKGIEEPSLTPLEGSAEWMILSGDDSKLDAAIGQLEEQVKSKPKNGATHFRLGVAYRKRYDSSHRSAGDFGKAIAAWKNGLTLVPSQYIWRRRIQQYGPRLDKPYSFYDWVHEARASIKKRGDTPHSLKAEPSGAEFAYPAKGKSASPLGEHPDPKKGVPTDERRLVAIEATAVPSTKGGSPAFRVHLELAPDLSRSVHWTNDAGPYGFYPDKNEAYFFNNLKKTGVPTDKAVSTETRRIEFEVKPVDGASLPKSLSGDIYYYVCEDVNGECLYARQPITISLK